jgi:hypothetical protein
MRHHRFPQPLTWHPTCWTLPGCQLMQIWAVTRASALLFETPGIRRHTVWWHHICRLRRAGQTPRTSSGAQSCPNLFILLAAPSSAGLCAGCMYKHQGHLGVGEGGALGGGPGSSCHTIAQQAAAGGTEAQLVWLSQIVRPSGSWATAASLLGSRCYISHCDTTITGALPVGLWPVMSNSIVIVIVIAY